MEFQPAQKVDLNDLEDDERDILDRMPSDLTLVGVYDTFMTGYEFPTQALMQRVDANGGFRLSPWTWALYSNVKGD
jgi:hypothetical protein